MFIDQFGLGNIMMPVQRYQPLDPGQTPKQRMLTGPGQVAPGGTQQMADPFTAAPAAPTSPAAPSMPPGWSTPPFNPAGTPPPINPAPSSVSGPVTPGAMPQTPPEPAAESVTIDEQGNVVEPEKPDFGPGIFKLREGPTRGDRMRAGFMMLSAAGQPNFTTVAGAVNAGLNEKQATADAYNQQLMQMTRPRYEEATDKDGRIIRKTYPAAYAYDPVTSTIREVPGAAAKAPKIEVLYDPTKPNDNRKMYKDARGLQRWQDTNELVNPEEGARLDRKDQRGGLTPDKAAEQFYGDTADLRAMMPNYMSLQRTLADTNNPFADISTLFAFMKTADPGSVVRPSEADMFSSAGSLSTSLANALNKITSGQSLTTKQQEQLAKVVDDLMIGQIEKVEERRASWETYFNEENQQLDNWNTSILNPYDPLYNNSLADDVRSRMASRGTPEPDPDPDPDPVPDPSDELEKKAQAILDERKRLSAMAGGIE